MLLCVVPQWSCVFHNTESPHMYCLTQYCSTCVTVYIILLQLVHFCCNVPVPSWMQASVSCWQTLPCQCQSWCCRSSAHSSSVRSTVSTRLWRDSTILNISVLYYHITMAWSVPLLPWWHGTLMTWHIGDMTHWWHGTLVTWHIGDMAHLFHCTLKL